MKIAICSTFVPFIDGGARNIVNWLAKKLEEAGHHVEIIYLPQIDNADILMQQLAVFRFIDLSNADRVICFRPSSHFIHHPHKIVWFIHHIREYYDLWNSKNRSCPNNDKYKRFRRELVNLDTAALKEAKQIFTNSLEVGKRLKKYNGLDSEVLYPPIFEPDNYVFHSMNDEIAFVSRVEPHKRQQLLIEAMQYTKSSVKLGVYGLASSEKYANELRDLIDKYKLKKKIRYENEWISEEKKQKIFSRCLAAAYLPLDEDSYGYPSLEASHCSKPILTTTDSGGVLELVENDYNGYVTFPEPRELAKAMDELYENKRKTKEMGSNALLRIQELDIHWDNVLRRLAT
jgi:glycosyltransferase involved in cell wall biosynthesis